MNSDATDLPVTAGLLPIERFLVDRSVIDPLHAYLRRAGEQGCEGVGFWLGTVEGTLFRVTSGMAPRQQPVTTQDGGVAVVIPGEELHRLSVWLYRHGLEIGAQVHSHPGPAYHSETDDDFAVATRAGSLSIVVPDFARREFELRESAVFRLSSSGSWLRVPTADADQLIQIAGA